MKNENSMLEAFRNAPTHKKCHSMIYAFIID